MFELRFSSITGSTNDDAAALLGTPASGGVVLQADYQRAGHGRRGRTWVAPPGSGLLFTAILPAPLPVESLPSVTFWSALAVAAGVREATGLRLALQWPNDLLLDGRKCCGILCVSRVSGTRAWVGCGVGLNVRRPKDGSDAPDLDPPIGYLSDRVADAERRVILGAILSAFETSLPRLADPATVLRAWEESAQLCGTPYRLRLDATGERLDAVARRVARDGSLIIEHDGIEQSVGLADARVIDAGSRRKRPES